MCKGKDRGLKKEVKGYWVDLVVGPFAAMGVDCDKVRDGSVGGCGRLAAGSCIGQPVLCQAAADHTCLH
jgi:hypothetical protein